MLLLAHHIHISGAMYRALCRFGGFIVERRGRMPIKVFLQYV